MRYNGRKAQSAIEFVTSYGWMFIIIMIVLAALYFSGIFGGRSIQPRAPPGECQVYRGGGPGSVSNINLVGVCGGELPRFVTHFGYFGQFQEFGNSNISVAHARFMPFIFSGSGNSVTLTGWIFSAPQGNTQTALAYGNFTGYRGPPWNAVFINTNETPYCNRGLFEAVKSAVNCMYSNPIALDTWIFVAIEYNGTTAVAYSITNGNVIRTYSSVPLSANVYIPAHSAVLISTPWNGIISNVQLYNTSLSQNAVVSLYDEGLGGAPINLKNLVGWWPLNGDIYDYSGNGNNGYAYNSAAQGGSYDLNYTPP
ncbi:MAG: hypothetical protein KGI06_02200 [Candidatus Micrarchaeota archaeon]|nr:hypothetical protein [Candidatus Micrarchaeota archaeon]